MHSMFLWLLLAAPLVLMVVSFTLLKRQDVRLGLVNTVLMGLGFANSLLGFASVILCLKLGPLETSLLGDLGIGISAYTDVFSSTIYSLVSFIGTIVINYSFRYLSGDQNQKRFLINMSGAVTSVLITVIAGNLLLLVCALASMHHFLNRLLLHYGDRPLAVLAARKRWVISRLSEGLLVILAILFYSEFGTLQIKDVLSHMQFGRMNEAYSGILIAATIALCLAAFLLSALIPFHGWILEVMETPTPVSALLHAGIINAGGFLLIRFSPLLEQSPMALNIIMLTGAVSALLAVLMMMVQPGVKMQLAYSTTAQMGFMIMECGLGAYHIAALHIILHSFYKAHLFLLAGDTARTKGLDINHIRSRDHAFFKSASWIALSIVGVLFVGEFLAQGEMDANILTLHLIFAVGLSSLMVANRSNESRAIHLLKKLSLFILTLSLYFFLQYLASLYFAAYNSMHLGSLSFLDVFLRAAIVIAFSVTMFIGLNINELCRYDGFKRFYVLLVNGFYINLWVNKWAVAYWFGPSKMLASPYTQRLFKKAEVLK